MEAACFRVSYKKRLGCTVWNCKQHDDQCNWDYLHIDQLDTFLLFICRNRLLFPVLLYLR